MSFIVVIRASREERCNASYIAARLNYTHPGYRSIPQMVARSGLEALQDRIVSCNRLRFDATAGDVEQAKPLREIRFASKTGDRKS